MPTLRSVALAGWRARRHVKGMEKKKKEEDEAGEVGGTKPNTKGKPDELGAKRDAEEKARDREDFVR